MSPLTEDRGTLKKFSRLRTLEAAGTIYVGALVAVNTDGKAVAASDASGLKVIGCAQNAAISGENVDVEEGCFAYDGTGIDNGDIGKTVYVVDDQTVSLSAGTNGVIAGTVYDVDAEGVWVAIGRTAQGVFQAAMTFASSAEITAGTEDGKPIAPDQLKAAGIAAMTKATGAEVTTGTDDAKYVTPKGIKDAGIAALTKATGAEVTTGTDDVKYVTAKALADAGIEAPAAAAAAIADVTDAGADSANIISALNSLLAAARTHGIISAT